jgi:hypothetical protein
MPAPHAGCRRTALIAFVVPACALFRAGWPFCGAGFRPGGPFVAAPS